MEPSSLVFGATQQALKVSLEFLNVSELKYCHLLLDSRTEQTWLRELSYLLC